MFETTSSGREIKEDDCIEIEVKVIRQPLIQPHFRRITVWLDRELDPSKKKGVEWDLAKYAFLHGMPQFKVTNMWMDEPVGGLDGLGLFTDYRGVQC